MPGADGSPVDLSQAFDRQALGALAHQVYADQTVVLPRTPMETQVTDPCPSPDPDPSPDPGT